MAGAELWSLYISLTTAETGFKALKSDLGLRPNHHQIERRVDAHVFSAILAYQLQRFSTYTLETRGDRRQWDTLVLVLRTHCYATLLQWVTQRLVEVGLAAATGARSWRSRP